MVRNKKSSNDSQKPRAPNYSMDEVKVLVDNVLPKYNLLYGDFSNEVTMEKRVATWAVVASNVSAVNCHSRTAEGCQSKFTHWKSETKKKAAKLLQARLKTGGGSSENPPLSEIEEIFVTMYSLTETEKRLVKIMGYESFAGIDGGMDVCSISENRQPTLDREIVNANTENVPEANVSTNKSTESGQSKKRSSRKRSYMDDEIPKQLLSSQLENNLILSNIATTMNQILEVEKERLEIEKKRLQLTGSNPNNPYVVDINSLD